MVKKLNKTQQRLPVSVKQGTYLPSQMCSESVVSETMHLGQCLSHIHVYAYVVDQ